VAVNFDYEQAGELKIGQVGIANLRIRTLDVERLVQEMRERVTRAPKLFGRAAVILDFGGLSQVPDVATAQALVDGLRSAGVLPVALAYGTSAVDLLSQQLGLPLLAYGTSAPSTSAPRPNRRRRRPQRNHAVPPVPNRSRHRPRRWPRWPTPRHRSRAACSWATCVRASSCMRKTAT
jgi:septum site-determining protein MinC